MTGVDCAESLGSELRGRFWFNHFARSSLSPFAMPRFTGALDGEETGRPFFNRHSAMSFDRLKRTSQGKRSPGHKLKPSVANRLVQNSKPHLSMKQTYILGIDIAKHKVRAALSNSEAAQERLLFEKDLPVNAGGLSELLLELRPTRARARAACSCSLKLPACSISTGRPRFPKQATPWW